jgi:hypothetical protein
VPMKCFGPTYHFLPEGPHFDMFLRNRCQYNSTATDEQGTNRMRSGDVRTKRGGIISAVCCPPNGPLKQLNRLRPQIA